MEKIKSEIKPLEQKPEEKEPKKQPEIEAWEGEGGTIEEPEGTLSEVPETVVEEEKVKIAWQELVAQAKEEFPEEIKRIVSKASRKEKLNSQEISALDAFIYHWFRFVFGIKNKSRHLLKRAYQKKQNLKSQSKTS